MFHPNGLSTSGYYIKETWMGSLVSLSADFFNRGIQSSFHFSLFVNNPIDFQHPIL